MKYKVRLNKKIYEVEVEKGEAILLDEYEAVAPTAALATPVAVNTAAPVAAQAPVRCPVRCWTLRFPSVRRSRRATWLCSSKP